MILVLYILSFSRLLVVGGRIKKGRIKKLDYKQTNKSMGTTLTAERMEDATHDKSTRKRRVRKTFKRF